ncbi:MAG: hypothetical protein ACFN02_11680, partial [Olsenella profusa]
GRTQVSQCRVRPRAVARHPDALEQTQGRFGASSASSTVTFDPMAQPTMRLDQTPIARVR